MTLQADGGGLSDAEVTGDIAGACMTTSQCTERACLSSMVWRPMALFQSPQSIAALITDAIAV